MRLTRKGALMAIATGTLVLSSCTDDKNYYDENYKKELYAANWEKQFGQIDPNQDWCMAAQKTVNITVDGTKTVQILTGNPYLNEGKLVGEFTVTNQLSAKIDLLKGLSVIYVAQRNEDGTKDVRTINVSDDGTFNVNFSSSAAKARTRAVTRSGDRSCVEFTTVDRCTPYATRLWYYSDQWNTYNSNFWDEATKKYNNWGDTYYYVGDNAYGNDVVVDQSILEAIKEIVPENEKSSYYNTIIQDVDLIVKEDGPITLTLASATTSNNAAIGYYIYTDKKVDNTDPCPEWLTGEWLKDNGYTGDWDKSYTLETRTGITDAQKLADKFVIIPNVQSIKSTGSDNCKTINLLYKNPSTGEISETFPAGTKIAFFIVPAANCNGSSYIDAKRTVFSFADMNVDAHRTSVGDGYYTGFSSDTYSSSHAATFKVQDKIVIGFEDAHAYSSTDFDYNDCIFLLDGNFNEEIIPDPIPEETPEPQSWILACEDLGDVDDFDFNDVVFSVSHVAGTTTATVTPLAAGGTLASKLYFGSTPKGEIHSFWGESGKATDGVYPMINTTSKGSEGESFEITVGENFTMTDNMGGFSIIVEQGGNSADAVIAAPEAGEAPQMICVPGTWLWPTERTNINAAYPSFTGSGLWDDAVNPWYKNWVSGKVVQ